MSDTLEDLYGVICERKENYMKDSYTCYLFDKGLDKILKKVGEESAETVIAAKNGVQEETVGEISDLIYHILVLMAPRASRWRPSWTNWTAGAGRSGTRSR
jgi:phosphoribosyl-ATP pyrophosphohydrolase